MTGVQTCALPIYNSLANLYDQMREYDKGFDALKEAYRAAESIDSPGRVATLKNTEYALSMDSGQTQRGLKALLEAVELERKIGAGPMVASSLVNLSDFYLKQKDYRNALSYGQQTLEQARLINKENSMATARVNIGQAYLALGRLAEGKKSIEEGMAWYEKSGDKPQLQAVLAEYGDALERAGDLSGAGAALASVTQVGPVVTAIVVAGALATRFGSLLGFLALVLAMINVVGGFVVTHRMLGMFQSKKK